MQKVLFAFSGGIDDVLAVHWLKEQRGCAVVAFLADLGQESYLEPLGELALESGAEGTIIADLRASFIENFALPTLQAGAQYEDYLLSTPLARYAICEALVSFAAENDIEVVGHGASNRGNDQVRVEGSLGALAPHLEVVAPIRELAFGSTEERLQRLRRHHLPEPESFRAAHSVDRNIWGCGQVHGGLSDPWESPPESLYLMTKSPVDAPDEPREIVIAFEQGTPRALDDEALSAVDLVTRLNEIGGEHGIGRLDHVENAMLAGKTREIYEAPAAQVLYDAHTALEEMTQSRDLGRHKRFVAEEFGRLVYEGQWYSELREALSQFVESTQRFVTGRVRVRLFKGHVTVLGRESTYSLYDRDLVNSPEEQKRMRRLAKGFVDVVTQSRKSEAVHRGLGTGGIAANDPGSKR
ncbi:MAG: argininosuccinate synthase [Planctomycetota bacterium]